jgi:protein-S-isoprenylcysteine O-methyltransferase Ste14
MTPWLSFSGRSLFRSVSAVAGAAVGMEPAGQHVNDTKIAGVVARPPLLFLAGLLLGLVADRLLPWPFTVPGPDLVHWMSGGSIILVGAALAAAGIRNFSRASTPVPTNQPTRALVTTGIHGWTRNPIYLGMFLIYGGIGIAAQSPWTLILTLPLAITIHYGVVAREERYLETKFGAAYCAYRTSVRRWL